MFCLGALTWGDCFTTYYSSSSLCGGKFNPYLLATCHLARRLCGDRAHWESSRLLRTLNSPEEMAHHFDDPGQTAQSWVLWHNRLEAQLSKHG
ncbi:GRAM domain-containing protein [Psidium guajava]|nr:GRAM domain-containing protein [Psidium guajava]